MPTNASIRTYRTHAGNDPLKSFWTNPAALFLIHIWLYVGVCSSALWLHLSHRIQSGYIYSTILLKTFIFHRIIACSYPHTSAPMPHICTPVLALPLHYILYCHLGLPVPRDHFSQAPINVATLPILLSNSFSIPPFPHKLTPRYTICFACSNCTVPPPLYTQRVPCMFVFPSLFLNLFIESFHVLTYMSQKLSSMLS